MSGEGLEAEGLTTTWLMITKIPLEQHLVAQDLCRIVLTVAKNMEMKDL